jgi:hypothetical protein
LGDEDLDLDDEESDEDDLGDFIVNRVDARGEAIDAPRRRRKRAKVAPAVRATSRQMMDAARMCARACAGRWWTRLLQDEASQSDASASRANAERELARRLEPVSDGACVRLTTQMTCKAILTEKFMTPIDALLRVECGGWLTTQLMTHVF